MPQITWKEVSRRMDLVRSTGALLEFNPQMVVRTKPRMKVSRFERILGNLISV